jgi:hypothetical protein
LRHGTSLNQSARQRKFCSQTPLLVRHFAPVAFMIIPRKVQDAVQNEDLYFLRN